MESTTAIIDNADFDSNVFEGDRGILVIHDRPRAPGCTRISLQWTLAGGQLSLPTLPPMSFKAVKHNVALPIHRLPPELLMTILYHAWQRFQGIPLTHVCHHWRALLLAMPEFWASELEHLKVSHYVSRELIHHCLALSSSRPIKVQVAFTGQSERELLAPHASRIVDLSVQLYDPNSLQAFEGLLKDGLPNLASLRYDSEDFCDSSQRTVALPLTDFPLPALRHLDIPAALPLCMVATPTLTHLVVYANPYDMAVFRKALSRCRSLRSLTFKADTAKIRMPYWHPHPQAPSEHPPRDEMPSLRLVSVAGSVPRMITTLAQLNMPPPASIQLRCSVPHANLRAVLESAPILAWNVLPTLTRLYLGRTHPAGRIHVLGYAAHTHTDEARKERLNIAMWHDWAAGDALADLLRGFTAAADVAALTVGDLPRLPLSLERSPWGQSWAGGDADGAIFERPRALRRLELLGGMPGSVKVRFARWFVRATEADAPPSGTLTLCWVLDVTRGWASEERARDELGRLGKLLEEFDTAERRLGRLELYGTLQSEVVATRVTGVSTNVRRCAEVAGPFIPRFEELVDAVVLV